VRGCAWLLSRYRTRICRSLLPLAMLTVTACSTWMPIDLATEPAPRKIRIRERDGGWLELRRAYLEGDSTVVGVRPHGVETRVAFRMVAETQGLFFSPSRTLTLLVAVPVGYFLMVVLLTPST
jgi:hypothetical protein